MGGVAAARVAMDAVFEGFGGDWAQFDRGRLDARELVLAHEYLALAIGRSA